MNRRWRKVKAPLPYQYGYAWGGLIIVDAYDMEDSIFLDDQFEIRHQASDEFMLEVSGSLKRAQEIATDLASIADWAGMSTTDELMLQARLMAFGAGYPGEVEVYNDWAAAIELERIVPYGG